MHQNKAKISGITNNGAKASFKASFFPDPSKSSSRGKKQTLYWNGSICSFLILVNRNLSAFGPTLIPEETAGRGGGDLTAWPTMF